MRSRREFTAGVGGVIAVTGLAGCSTDSEGAEGVTRDFFQALIAEDLDSANELLSPESPVYPIEQSLMPGDEQELLDTEEITLEQHRTWSDENRGSETIPETNREALLEDTGATEAAHILVTFESDGREAEATSIVGLFDDEWLVYTLA